jgi:hypothetical protein
MANANNVGYVLVNSAGEFWGEEDGAPAGQWGPFCLATLLSKDGADALMTFEDPADVRVVRVAPID